MPAPTTPRFEEALAYAARLHTAQVRKGTEVPYVSHLLAVCAIVLEHGGDEDEAIAALLHDAAEDQGGRATLDEIGRRFGSRVARIVEGCTDTFEKPKPPWRGRKEAYLARLERESDPSTLLVGAADKLHNVRSTLAAHRAGGDAVWSRFRTGSKADQVWYHRELLRRYRSACGRPGEGPGLVPLVGELERAVSELEKI
jgi:GTP pyrophosphokinase